MRPGRPEGEGGQALSIPAQRVTADERPSGFQRRTNTEASRTAARERWEIEGESPRDRREWCVPSALLNEHAKIRPIDEFAEGL